MEWLRGMAMHRIETIISRITTIMKLYTNRVVGLVLRSKLILRKIGFS